MTEPHYLIDEGLLRKNLATIKDVAERAGVEFIVALKANATWPLFSIFREYIGGATASSLAEARLVFEEFYARPHVYAPVYNDREIDEILGMASHVTFNSLAQLERFGARAREKGVSCGVRINPGWSPVETELYNPCAKGSRLGVESLDELPDGVDGLHFHSLFESVPSQLERTLEEVEKRFGHLLPQLKWLNMGGGHLVTHRDYDRDFLVDLLVKFREKYPNLRVILEPGSAFTWQTGVLVATVEDIVGETLMLDVSFACHMPDCLEMPYKPIVRGAHEPLGDEKRWRIGGNSCLAGDVMGDWAFDEEPHVGDQIVFEDMIHYTMVKTTMFNGVSHPSIAVRRLDGTVEVLCKFGYEDYKKRNG